MTRTIEIRGQRTTEIETVENQTSNPILTSEVAEGFRLTLIFRLGDLAIEQSIRGTRTEFTLAVRTAGTPEIGWTGFFENLGHLMASVCPEVLADYRAANETDMRSAGKEADEIDRARFAIKSYEFGLIERDSDIVIPALWDSIDWNEQMNLGAVSRTARILG